MNRRISLAASLAALLILGLGTSASAQTEAISPGTVITTKNWTQYKQFIPPGMQVLFEGKHFWKFPVDFKMVVGPTHHYPPPAKYIQDTEKYSHLVQIRTIPNGGHIITGYVAGAPFANPSGPMKGYEILCDDWYAYVPYLTCGLTNSTYMVDRFNNIHKEEVLQVYRRLSHISDAGHPINEPSAPGLDYTEYVMVLSPEESKYTTSLTIYYEDLTRHEDTFLYIPALRRSLRLSTSARCSPFIGTDLTLDDPRIGGFNGGLAEFDADYKGAQKILTMLDENPDQIGSLNDYYHSIFFPKPAVGKWEVRDAWKISVKRIPALAKGYCYGNRVLYVDKETHLGTWTELYDSNMRLWKVAHDPQAALPIPGEGVHPTLGGWGTFLDLQNSHLSFYTFSKRHGRSYGFNQECKNYQGRNFDDVKRYSTAAGLAQILR